MKSLTLLTALLCTTTIALAAVKQKMTDRQIVQVMLTLNEGEIAAAQLASEKSMNKEVREFANMMLTQHSSSKSETLVMSRKGQMSPVDSMLSTNLKNDATAINEKLQSATAGATFDKMYMSQQVDMHERALKTLDQDLIPKAKNMAFSDQLKKTRAAVAEHLEMAKTLNNNLNQTL